MRSTAFDPARIVGARKNAPPFRWVSANSGGGAASLRSNAGLAALSVVNFIAQVAHVVLPSPSCSMRPIVMAGIPRLSD